MARVRGAAVSATIVATALAACGPPPAPVAPATPPPVIKHYAPLQFAADAHTPGLAVILGSDEHDGSTVLTLPPTGPASAATTSPPPPPASIAFTAAHLVAAELLGKDVVDVGFAPLPAAGSPAHAAAVLVATALGTKLDASASVLGGLRADGTIVSLGGASAQALAGKKHVGIPPGATDAAAAAKQRGADTAEVADVRAAYQLLTAQPLVQSLPVPEADMALDVGATLDPLYRSWQQKVAGEWSSIVQLESAGRLPPLLASLRDRAKRAGEQAEQLKKRGLGAAALSRMLAAWELAWTANRTYDLLSRVQGGDVAGATTALAQLAAADPRSSTLFDTIGGEQRATLAGNVQMIAAFETALARWAVQSALPEQLAAATTLLDGLANQPVPELGAPRAADQIVDAVAPALLALARAQTDAARTEAQLALEPGVSVSYTPKLPELQRLATIVEDVAAGELHDHEARRLAPVAKDAGVSADAARQLASRTELVTRGEADLVIAASTPPSDPIAAWGDASPPAVLLALAHADLAHRAAADLALPAGDVPGLPALLAAADRTARASARAARVATGAIPVPARAAYQIATVLRAGDAWDQLAALARYGEATAFCRIAVMLARN